jgi:hypothetical protein
MWAGIASDHLKLGLQVTRGLNVQAVNYSGQPALYYSYSPLASWLLVLPLALGCPAPLAAHLVALPFFLWFLLALWLFSRNVWGETVANVAVAVLALLPLALRYGLMVQQETMALGPTFSFLALYTSPRPRRAGWSARMITYGLVAALLSWYNLVLILPCLWAEWRQGNRRSALTVAASVAGVSLLLPVAGLFLSGVPLATALAHLRFRLGNRQSVPGSPYLSHLALVHRFMVWSFTDSRYFGTLAAVLTAGVVLMALYVRLRKLTPVTGDGWLFALAAYGMPLTLFFPNWASPHDYFMYLYAPLVAVCCALAVTSLHDRPGDLPRSRLLQPAAAAFLLVAIFATSTWQVRAQLAPSSYDYDLQNLAATLGRVAQGQTVMLGSVGVMGPPTGERLDLADRDLTPPLPFVTFLTGKTAYVCRNASELATLLGQLPPAQPVVIVEKYHDLEPLPEGVMRQEIGLFTVATWRTPGRAAAARDGGPL